jgi:hypothetical protein
MFLPVEKINHEHAGKNQQAAGYGSSVNLVFFEEKIGEQRNKDWVGNFYQPGQRGAFGVDGQANEQIGK